MTISEINEELRDILQKKEELNLSQKDMDIIQAYLQYIKDYAYKKIIQYSVKNDPRIISQIEQEISRYGTELRKKQNELQKLEEEQDRVKNKMAFKYPEFVPPERQEGVSKEIQDAIEKKQREIYETERMKAEKIQSAKVEENESKELYRIEDEITRVQIKIANLSVMKEKYEKQDIKKFLQTLNMPYKISDEEYKKLVNLCAEGMIYPNGKIEFERTPWKHSESLLVRSDNGKDYIPNPEAIRNFVTFLDGHSNEIEEVNNIYKINEQTDSNRIKIERIHEEIIHRESLLESVQNDGKDYEEYLRDISNKLDEIKEKRFKINNSRLPAKQMGFFARLFSRIFRNKKIDTSNIDRLESELNDTIIMLQQKIKENEFRYSGVREAYHMYLEKNMKNLEIDGNVEENGLKINQEDWDVLNSRPWLEQRKYDKIYELLSSDNAKSSQEIKMTESFINTKKQEMHKSIDNLSEEARKIYENSEYSNIWINGESIKEKDNYKGKYIIGGLFDRYRKIIGNKEKETEDEKVSPYIALKVLNAVLEMKGIETFEDAAKMGIIITPEEMEEYKNVINYMENEYLRRISNRV